MQQANPMILFLDFDGVLHPKGAGQQHFTRLPLLETFLRKPEFATVRVVISSTWRDAYSLSELRNFFSPDIAARIIGTTKTLDDYATEYERGEEIEAWLESNGATHWVALDDDKEGFTRRLHNRLAFCDGRDGLQESDLIKLREFLLDR